MHNIPVDSGFLAAKFIQLSEKLDVHLLAWDEKTKVDLFINQQNLPAEYKCRIHLGYSNNHNLFKYFFAFLFVFISNKKLRSYLFNDAGSFLDKVKFTISYLPAIKLNPDIIHFEFGTLARKAVELKSIITSKLITSFRGYDLNYAGLDEKNYYNEVWKHFDGFHFLGNDLKKRAITRGYAGSMHEAVIPPAIDTDYFSSLDAVKNDTKLVILSVGRVVWKKGYEYAIRAAALLKQKGISFEYRIIGSGSNLQAIQFMIDELKLQNDVMLLGELNSEEIKVQLNEAHVFLHPAISEGFSNAVIEAQSMGVPVICTDADGLPENIEDNVTGFVVPKWDAEAIAEKLEWCWDNKHQLSIIGKAGVERAREKFKIEDQVNALILYYTNINNS